MAGTKIVFIGRLEEDTGILKFLKWLDKNSKNSVGFIGDGSFKSNCQKYGTVHGFADPKQFIKKADVVVPGGYLSYIEAKKRGCKIMVFPNNPLKNDYWKEIEKIKVFPTWSEVADVYLNLWKK